MKSFALALALVLLAGCAGWRTAAVLHMEYMTPPDAVKPEAGPPPPRSTQAL